MSTTVPERFNGWVCHGPEAGSGGMKLEDFDPKPFTERDVDIAVTHCGMCGSDIHTARAGWGPTDFPVVVGHEIVGKAVRVGKEVTHVKVGDTVGVGAQSDACLKPDCEECSSGINEQYCPHMVAAFNSRYADGSKAHGGYAAHARHPGHFVLKIPDEIPPAEAAPMLCAGATLWSPISRANVKGKNVGIIGLGGLGHFGLLWAKALGAKRVVVLSRKASKREDALKLGADEYIATDDDADWASKNANTLNHVFSTVSSPKMPLSQYLSLLKAHGTFTQLGAPEDLIPAINAFTLIPKNVSMGGSCIASPAEIRDMLNLVAEKKIKPWINERPMSEANQVVKDFNDGKARYRFVLVNSEAGKI